MTVRRSYRQFCGLAKALDVLGERWTLLLARELLLGPRRYSELLASLPGVTTNLLAARLQDLEANGLVERTDDGYRLTEAGAALEPVVMELARFGGRYLRQPARGERVDLGWGLLSLKRRYRGGLELTLAVHADDDWYTLGFEPEWLRVSLGRPDRADATVHATKVQLQALLFRSESLDRLLQAGLGIEGDARLVRRALSSLGPPAEAHQAPRAGSGVRWTNPRSLRT